MRRVRPRLDPSLSNRPFARLKTNQTAHHVKLIRTTLAATVAALLLYSLIFKISRNPPEASVRLADGTVLRYLAVTHSKTQYPSQVSPPPYHHHLAVERSAFRNFFQRAPSNLQPGRGSMPRQIWGSLDCPSEQALWFEVVLPQPTSPHGSRAMLAEQTLLYGPARQPGRLYSLEDDHGYESEVAYADIRNRALIVPGNGPRRSHSLTLVVREILTGEIQRSSIPPPLARLTIKNPLRPIGPILSALDSLPSSKFSGGYEIFLKDVSRGKRVGVWFPDLNIDWEIRRDGVIRSDWELIEAHLADGSGNYSRIGLHDPRQKARSSTALASDDPVWKIRLLFRRSSSNRNEYHPVMHIPDLPVPKFGETIKVDRTITNDPWSLTIDSVWRGYAPAWQQSQMRVRVKGAHLGKNDSWVVLKSSIGYLTTSGIPGGPESGEFIFTDPGDLKFWSMDLGANTTLDAEFQCRVRFLPR